GDHADAGDRHKDTACLALTRVCDKLASELCGTIADVAPSLQHRQNDGCDPILIDKKIPDILFECSSLTRWDEQAERFHDPANLVGKLDGDPDQPGACCHKPAGQHAVEAFNAHLAKEPDFCKMRQTISIVRVRLV